MEGQKTNDAGRAIRRLFPAASTNSHVPDLFFWRNRKAVRGWLVERDKLVAGTHSPAVQLCRSAVPFALEVHPAASRPFHLPTRNRVSVFYLEPPDPNDLADMHLCHAHHDWADYGNVFVCLDHGHPEYGGFRAGPVVATTEAGNGTTASGISIAGCGWLIFFATLPGKFGRKRHKELGLAFHWLAVVLPECVSQNYLGSTMSNRVAII